MKTVLITGGANGIGLGLVDYYLERSWRVVTLDRDFKSGDVIKRRRSALPFSFFPVDLCSENEILDFTNHFLTANYKLDAFIHNAMSDEGGLPEAGWSEFNRSLQVGIVAPYLLIRTLLPRFADSASIVNIASTRAFMSQPGRESYAAAKGGLIALTHALAVSLAGKIRVNAISPGWIDSRGEGPFSPSDEAAQPAGRVGTIEDVAKLCYFLTSDDASFITGENIVLDGGMTKQMIYPGEYGWSLTPPEQKA